MESNDQPRAPRLRPGDPPGRVQQCPFVVQSPAGKYAWCRCQRSSSYPFCDGSHRDLGDAEIASLEEHQEPQPLKVVLEKTLTVAWCACGRSAGAPFCDGSHAD